MTDRSIRPPGSPAGQGFPILYVDDEDGNLVVFEESFGEEFEVRCASSGEQALAVIEREEISVLIADQRMPGMTGIDLCERIRLDHPDVLRILMTAFSDQQIAIDAINRGGVIGYILKPWDMHNVLQLLRNTMARAHLEQTVRELRGAIRDRERQSVLAYMRERILHDVGNALQPLICSCEVLDDLLAGGEGPNAIEVLRLLRAEMAPLQEAVNYLAGLHEATHALTRSETPAAGAHSVRELLKTIAVMMRGRVGPGVRLHTRCDDDLTMWADRVAISRILINLVTNASQAVGEARTEQGTVRIEATGGDDDVRFVVSDNGPGVPSGVRDRMFTPFFTTRRDSGGTGLGLALSRDLARANGGDLALVDAADGQGAAFVLSVPARPAGALPARRAVSMGGGGRG